MRGLCSTVCVAMIVVGSVVSAQDKQFLEDWARGANSPGSTLTLKETGRKNVDGRTVVSYRLFASGLPKNQHLTLWTWNLGSGPQGVADAFVNAEGLIVNRLADPAHQILEDPIDLRVFAGRGEPKRVALTSDDGTLQAFAAAMPFPLEQTSGECRLSVEMAAPNYASVVLHGSGFQPNEALVIEFASGPEAGKQQASATSTGIYTAAILPVVKGQKAGKASTALTSSKCHVAVQFPWGEGSYRIE
jgi:hypothetical protein